jgi:hypothetical protein
MRRRELMLLLGGAMTAARALRAQQKAMPVIGFFSIASPGPSAPLVTAFHQGLSETGYVEGQNVAIEYRWAEGRQDRLSALAADLVGRRVDVIATSGGESSALAAKNATSTIPIVFLGGAGDPIGPPSRPRVVAHCLYFPRGGTASLPVREKRPRSVGSQPVRPFSRPSHTQTAAKARGFSPTASGCTAEADSPPEREGFEASVPL